MLRRKLIVALMVAGLAVMADAQSPPGALPELGSTGVVVPWEDFKKILDQLQRPSPTPVPRPPVDFALSACDAVAEVDGEGRSVRVTLGFTVQTLVEDRWVEVPVIPDGVALSSVTMDGAPARLYRAGPNHAVALRGAGQRRFVLEYAAPVEEVRGTWTARLRFPAAPAVALEVVVPRSDVDLQVDGAVVREVLRRDGGVRVRAALGRHSDTTLTWFPRLEVSDRESKVFGELATLISIGEGAMRGTSHVSLTIHGGGVDVFRVELPAELSVLDVHGAGLRGWEVEPGAGGDRRLLRVDLAYRAQGSVGLSFDFERPLGDASASLELPDLALRDVLRERGFVAVAAASNVEITPGDGLTNAAPIDPSELPPVLTAGNDEALLYAFKHLRHPVEIPLEVVKHADVAVKRTLVERAELASTLTRSGKLATSARFRVTNNRKQFLELRLPEGASVWGAYLEGRPVKVARRDDGALLVPLLKTATDARGQLRPFQVEVVYFSDGPGLGPVGRRTLHAPSLDVDVLELDWVVYLPRELHYLGLGGSLDPVESANRIVRLGALAYNLADDTDRAAVAVVDKGGALSLTDGLVTSPVDALEIGDGRNREVTEQDLAGLERHSAGQPPPAPATRTMAIPDPAPNEPEPLDEGRNEAWRTQVAQNVALGDSEAAAPVGGGAVGVLPVQIVLPHDGLRMSFAGRLLVAGETSTITAWWVPTHWRVPRLNRFWTFGLAFLLGLVVALAMVVDPKAATMRRWVVVGLAVVALGLVLTASNGHGLSFLAALAAAALTAWVVARFRAREQRELGGGF